MSFYQREDGARVEAGAMEEDALGLFVCLGETCMRFRVFGRAPRLLPLASHTSGTAPRA